jgi:hypothetical protein
MIYLTAYVTFMVLFMAYSATTVSRLAVRRFQLPFRDFQGLLSDGTYGLGVVYGNAHEDLLKVSRPLAEFLATERRCIVLPVRYELNLYMLRRGK